MGAGHQGFPRGEAVAEIGSSEPISVTDEECGQLSYGFASVRSSSRSLDIAIPHPTRLTPGHLLNYGMIATGNH